MENEEVTKEKGKHNRYRSLIDRIVQTGEEGLSRSVPYEIRTAVRAYLNNQGFVDIAKEFEEKSYVGDLGELLDRYNDLIEYCFDQAIIDMDPLKDHNLMMKKVSEMTGYEYERYLQLVNKRGKTIS